MQAAQVPQPCTMVQLPQRAQKPSCSTQGALVQVAGNTATVGTPPLQSPTVRQGSSLGPQSAGTTTQAIDTDASPVDRAWCALVEVAGDTPSAAPDHEAHAVSLLTPPHLLDDGAPVAHAVQHQARPDLRARAAAAPIAAIAAVAAAGGAGLRVRYMGLGEDPVEWS